MLSDLSDRSIIFVGGKGGVGKTTSASALAYYFADQGQRVLLISTDPAHSLADALDLTLSHEVKSITPNLSALELDVSAVADAHFANIESLIELYASDSMLDKVKKQLALAKDAPGGQEAALLESVCTYMTTFKTLGYDKLIFDTAPTGHTLRLLVLPEMMSTWTDGLLAQQKKQQKFKQAAERFWNRVDDEHSPLSEKKQQPWQKAMASLEKRKQLFKESRDILHDETQVVIVFVMIPEKLPLFETKRALEALKKVHLRCGGLIVNQVIPSDQCQEDFWHQRYLLQQDVIEQIKKELELKTVWLPLKSNQIIGDEALRDFFKEEAHGYDV